MSVSVVQESELVKYCIYADFSQGQGRCLSFHHKTSVYFKVEDKTIEN